MNDVKVSAVKRGQMGAGAVYHIAWLTDDDTDHLG